MGAPYVLKINPSLLPVMVTAVSKEGMDTAQLTQYLNEEMLPQLEGIAGVARISTSGAVNQQIHVVLDQTLIELVNLKIADAINGKMDEALNGLNGTKAELDETQVELEEEGGKDNA